MKTRAQEMRITPRPYGYVPLERNHRLDTTSLRVSLFPYAPAVLDDEDRLKALSEDPRA